MIRKLVRQSSVKVQQIAEKVKPSKNSGESL